MVFANANPIDSMPVNLSKQIHIGKISDFLNDPTKTPVGHSEPLQHEMSYYSYGAVTKAQLYQKTGQYYIVNWENEGPAANLILRLDYRQSLTKDEIHTLEIPFDNMRGSRKTTLSITGDAYHKNGTITSWKISVIDNGTVVAHKRSYIW